MLPLCTSESSDASSTGIKDTSSDGDGAFIGLKDAVAFAFVIEANTVAFSRASAKLRLGSVVHPCSAAPFMQV
jgi:hypothetical protein